MKFIIESSAVPIYNRIATAFVKTLMEFGHTVHFIDASGFSEESFINTINGIDIDFYISTNELNFIQKKVANEDLFIFQKVYKNIIFVHHDNLFSSFHSIEYISLKLDALIDTANRSHHFCLETSNVDLLKSVGIPTATSIKHASEFAPPKKVSEYQWGVTFIGHLMANLTLYPAKSVPGGHHLQVMAWNRLIHSSYAIQPQIDELIKDTYFLSSLELEDKANSVVTKQFLLANMNKFSSPMRGELISTIKKHRVDIFGGDLSYGRINDPLMMIKQDNIHYQPATSNYHDASSIYHSSRISLNISSLQFDTAVNNRFFDAINSGGFVLTDKRTDMTSVGDFSKEISYETPEELCEKISFWSDKKNDKKYYEIKDALYKICSKEFTYQNAVNTIINEIKIQ